jgi:hypothetical protein
MNDVYQTTITVDDKQQCEFFNMTLDGVIKTVLYELLDRHAIHTDKSFDITQQQVMDKVLDAYGQPSTHTRITFIRKNFGYVAVETWLRYVGK